MTLWKNVRFSYPILSDSAHADFAHKLCDLLFRNRGIQLALRDDHTRDGPLTANLGHVLQCPLPTNAALRAEKRYALERGALLAQILTHRRG